MARLYLITPPLRAAQDFAPRFKEALAAGDVASVLAHDIGPEPKRVFAPLFEIAAAHDVALLIEGDPRLAARLGADGAHVDFAEVADAVENFKSQRIVGAGGLKMRDDAMAAGEAGADYVMFGEPVNGVTPALEATVERVSWWAEIFQTPCVAYAGSLDDVATLAQAGADFVALGEALWNASAPAGAIRAAMKALGSP